MYKVVPAHVHRQNEALLSYGLIFLYTFIVKSIGGLYSAVSGTNNVCGLILSNESLVKRINRFSSEHQTISRINPKRHASFFGLKFGSNQNSIVVEPSCINNT